MYRKAVTLLAIALFTLPSFGQYNWQQDFLKGRYRRLYHHFSTEMRSAITFQNFKKSLNQLNALYGRFESIEPLNTEKGSHRLFTENGALQLIHRQGEKGIETFFIGTLSYEMPAEARSLRILRERHQLVLNDSQSLRAELWLPDGVQKPPVLVMVHGSGALDMDESVGATKVFLDLAYAMAKHGIATFRYEKRTLAFSEWQKSDSLTLNAECIQDALSALRVLRQSTHIDTSAIWVLGHSLGGYALPLILSQEKSWAGGIILAGSSRPLTEIVPEQIEYLSQRDGKISSTEKRLYKKVKRFDMCYQQENWKAMDRMLPKLSLVYYWPLAFFKNTRHYDPPMHLKNHTSQRVLVLQGGRDYQVDTTHFNRWKQAADSERIAFKLMPASNHLFIAGEGASYPAEYFVPANVEQGVSEVIADFILKQGAFFNIQEP